MKSFKWTVNYFQILMRFFSIWQLGGGGGGGNDDEDDG